MTPDTFPEVPATAPWAPVWGVWKVQPFVAIGNILVCIFDIPFALFPKLQSSRGCILFVLDPSGPNSLRPIEVGTPL